MHLPYIRKIYEGKDITLIPIMVGQINAEAEAKFGQIFAPYYRDPENLFIISTDFCHWGSNFDYQPYDSNKGQIHEYIKDLDEQGIRLIEEHSG
jgi:AmmeMemoRadiSam system protein B